MRSSKNISIFYDPVFNKVHTFNLKRKKLLRSRREINFELITSRLNLLISSFCKPNKGTAAFHLLESKIFIDDCIF